VHTSVRCPHSTLEQLPEALARPLVGLNRRRSRDLVPTWRHSEAPTGGCPGLFACVFRELFQRTATEPGAMGRRSHPERAETRSVRFRTDALGRCFLDTHYFRDSDDPGEAICASSAQMNRGIPWPSKPWGDCFAICSWRNLTLRFESYNSVRYRTYGPRRDFSYAILWPNPCASRTRTWRTRRAQVQRAGARESCKPQDERSYVSVRCQ
jgi:hypothetical protein